MRGGGIGVLVVGAVLAAAMYMFYGARTTAHSRHSLPVAFGPPGAGGAELHLAVAMSLPRRDPPILKYNVIQWDLWVDEHFQLHDASGARVRMQRTHFSELISEQKAGGPPEFFLKAIVTPGAGYTLDFIPYVGGDKFRYSFTAPAAAQDAERAVFELTP